MIDFLEIAEVDVISLVLSDGEVVASRDLLEVGETMRNFWK